MQFTYIFMCKVQFLQPRATVSVKRPTHSQLNSTILLCDVIPDGKTEQTAQL
jgi:hypothetical protein